MFVFSRTCCTSMLIRPTRFVALGDVGPSMRGEELFRILQHITPVDLFLFAGDESYLDQVSMSVCIGV